MILTTTDSVQGKNATEDLEKKAAKLGADAVIGLKFATQGNNFMLLGTAVKLR